MNQYRIRISDRFLQALVMAAVEAYCHGDGSNKTEIETIGPIWGYRRVNVGTHVIFLECLAVSLSAERQVASVTPKAEATKLMAGVMDRIAPELTLLGDFHSHPYKDRGQVTQYKGFEFSPDDFMAFLSDDDLWDGNSEGPVMLVVTICRLGKVHNTSGKRIRKNVWQFDLGQFRFWINASVGFLDEEGKRQHSSNKHSNVFLDLNSRFINFSGDRVAV
jgi:hypothetical protein